MEADVGQARRLTGQNAIGIIHFQGQSCGFRQSFVKMCPCPSSQLKPTLASIKVVYPEREGGSEELDGKT